MSHPSAIVTPVGVEARRRNLVASLASVALVFGQVSVPAILLAQARRDAGGLERVLEAELSRFPAKSGVFVKHLGTGETAAVAADEPFNSASVIKIPVMVLAYRLADQGQLDLDERVTIAAGDIRGGSGIYRFHDLGLAPTLRDVILQMIITSDNTATDIMIRRVGGIAKVNEWLASAGYKKTTLNQTTYELFRKRYELLQPDYKSLSPQDVYALQTGNLAFGSSPRALLDRVTQELRATASPNEWTRRSVTDPLFWLGTMTPRETAAIVEGIERGTVASAKSCGEMKRFLLQQQSGARRMPHFVNVNVGHKTGDIPPVVANDVGVVYARSGPIVAAFFTNDGRGLYGELEDAIGRATQVVVDYFDGGQVLP
ncbi:MAG: serine hydrolase [Vicinamibacterales bacterium]